VWRRAAERRRLFTLRTICDDSLAFCLLFFAPVLLRLTAPSAEPPEEVFSVVSAVAATSPGGSAPGVCDWAILRMSWNRSVQSTVGRVRFAVSPLSSTCAGGWR